MKKLMFDAIEAKLYVQRKRLPPKPLEKLEKGVLTRTQEVDNTDSINRNVLIQIAGPKINTHKNRNWIIFLILNFFSHLWVVRVPTRPGEGEKTGRLKND